MEAVALDGDAAVPARHGSADTHLGTDNTEPARDCGRLEEAGAWELSRGSGVIASGNDGDVTGPTQGSTVTKSDPVGVDLPAGRRPM